MSRGARIGVWMGRLVALALVLVWWNPLRDGETSAGPKQGFAAKQASPARRTHSGESATGLPTQAVGERAPGSTSLRNKSAYIPPQCYTKTVDARGEAHNPCFTCHVRRRAPNFVRDTALQLAYDFTAPAKNNPWHNLFVDRRPSIAAQSDEAVLRYVREDNYRDVAGRPGLATRLRSEVPAAWDADGDGRYAGFVPDAHFNFDDQGFDRNPNGGFTGWRAYGYYPLPGSFWPTNGSAGDVLIRLPAAFRHGLAGEPSLDAYRVNLAIVEALVTRRDVPIVPVAEQVFGIDLNQNGALDQAEQVTYVSLPRTGRRMRFVGAAQRLQDEGKAWAVKGLFPAGTEFLHSVRYLDVVAGEVRMASRMKELRYARKQRFLAPLQLDERAAAEAKEKRDFPERLRTLTGDVEQGVRNGLGWVYQGFIEDAQGVLRPQTFEEIAFCMGCHGGVGATDDGIFSFPRKLASDAPQRGWFHWGQHGLAGLAEPRRADGQLEYAHYLEVNGAGDEYRANQEVLARFFKDGELIPERLSELQEDIGVLLWPSPERALSLDKAYRAVVKEQSFHLGRDAVLQPLDQVHRTIPVGEATGITRPESPCWFAGGGA